MNIASYRPTLPSLRALLRGFEGYRTTAYQDRGGVWTAGIGHTGHDVTPGATYDDAQIQTWLTRDIAAAEATIYRFVPASVISLIPDDSLDALISFVFNVGSQAFVDPKTGKRTNFSNALSGQNFDEVGRRFLQWDKCLVNGRLVVVGGLMQRRAAEAALWNKGFEDEAHPVPKAQNEQPGQSGVAPALSESHEEPAPALTVPANDVMAHTAPVPAPVPAIPLPEGIENEATIRPVQPTSARSHASALVGLGTTVLGAAAAVAPDSVTVAGQQMREISDSLPIMGTIGSILIVIGAGLLVWRQIRTAKDQRG